jgi:hypothetical protein
VSGFAQTVMPQAGIVKMIEWYMRPRTAEHDLAKRFLDSFAFPIRPPHNGWQQLIVTIEKAGAMCPFQC